MEKQREETKIRVDEASEKIHQLIMLKIAAMANGNERKIPGLRKQF